MSWRTVVIQGRCKLDYRLGYMVIRGREIKRVFLDEIAVLIIESPTVSITGSLIEALTEKKIKVIFCDTTRNPISELVPHHGCHDSSERIRKQIQWSEETKKRIWQIIIRDKISKQADFLEELSKTTECSLLRRYIPQVELGDVTNREGHAAKVYFNALFGMKFTRGADHPVNYALNYGYSIILSIITREISACGCLTQLGIFHNNLFNHFNLGCDLMEPFRILVDRCVVIMNPDRFTSSEKHSILDILNQEVYIERSRQTVLNTVKIFVRNVLNALNENIIDDIPSYRLMP